MPRDLTRAGLLDLVCPGQSIFVAGATAEATGILSAWREAHCLAGVTLVGLQLPGLNHVSPLDFGEDCRFRTNFLSPGLRKAFAAGFVDVVPMHHYAFYDWLAGRAKIDLAVFQVSPPNATGQCNLGPGTDLLPAILSRSDVRLVAQINPRLPACADGLSIDVDRFEAIYREETALPAFKVDASEPATALAANAAVLIEDGAVIQTGIGRLPDQVLSLLASRRDLKLHSGAVAASGLALLECGAAESIVTGVALGDENFYTRIAAAPHVAFRPVSVTHGPAGLHGIARFVALNTALEIDLFGQANCETIGGKLRASFGGLNDFVRAARMSPGGRSVLMLQASHPQTGASRIVARLDDPALVSVQRGDADTVVTEYGVAELCGLDMDARAAALIAIASPEHRKDLTESWSRSRAAST